MMNALTICTNTQYERTVGVKLTRLVTSLRKDQAQEESPLWMVFTSSEVINENEATISTTSSISILIKRHGLESKLKARNFQPRAPITQ